MCWFVGADSHRIYLYIWRLLWKTPWFGRMLIYWFESYLGIFIYNKENHFPTALMPTKCNGFVAKSYRACMCVTYVCVTTDYVIIESNGKVHVTGVKNSCDHFSHHSNCYRISRIRIHGQIKRPFRNFAVTRCWLKRTSIYSPMAVRCFMIRWKMSGQRYALEFHSMFQLRATFFPRIQVGSFNNNGTITQNMNFNN